MTGRLFPGWVVVGAAALVLFLAYGAQYAFGVFFAALLEEFGWSRASLSGAFSLYVLVYSGFAVAAGRLTDRWGPRAVIGLGGAFLGLGLAGMSGVTALWQPFVLYGGIAAVGMSTAFVPCTATVVRWFVRRRGLAVGIASAGGSLGTLVLPPVAHLLVSGIGWRWAYVAFGAVILLALNGLARLMRRDPESLGLAPDGDPAPAPAAEQGAGPDWTTGAALRTRAFWILFSVFSASWVPVFVPVVHLVAHARDLGIPPLGAATLISATGVGAVGGRVVMGAVSDRIGRRPALAAGFVLETAAFLGFLGPGSLAGLYLPALVFGFAYGSVSTMLPAVVSDFFGRAQAGTLVGILFGLAGPVAAVGPVMAGWVYDRRGSYDLAWWLSAACNAGAVLLLAAARPPAGAPPRRGAGPVAFPPDPG